MKDWKSLVETVADIISKRTKEDEKILVAIDGRCASGKTTLALGLQQVLNCEVIHMDDFFLRPEQRSEKRLATPGENIDHERFLQEVLLPLKKGEHVVYSPFDCKTMTLGESVLVSDKPVYIMEGAYVCHETLREYYDLHIFLDVSSEEQMKRIIERNGEQAAEVFRTKWIPMEECYFEAFDVVSLCEYCFTT